MAADQIELQGLRILRGDIRIAEFAKACGQAVHHFFLLQQLLHVLAGMIDFPAAFLTKIYVFVITGHLDNFFNR
ncbi:hypothetical protein D3C75_976360 [compost metagenome]